MMILTNCICVTSSFVTIFLHFAPFLLRALVILCGYNIMSLTSDAVLTVM